MRTLRAFATREVRPRGPLVVAALLLGALCLLPATPAAAVPTKLVLAVPLGDLEEGARPATLYALLDESGAPADGTTVTLTVLGGPRCATEGVDFSLASATIFIPEGQARGTTTITVIDDTIYDDGESVCLSASSTNPTLTSIEHSFRIIENDEPSGPRNLRVTPGDGELRLSWDAASDTPRGYQVFHKKATAPAPDIVTGDPDTGWVRTDLGSSVTTHTLTGLTNGVAYDVKLRGRFSVRTWSPWIVASGTPDDPNAGVSTDAALRGLTLSDGTLAPPFDAATLTYAATVANRVASVTVTPTARDRVASVTVEGTPVTSGQASGAIALDVGAPKAIAVVVTAEDGVTTRTYTVTVTRLAGGGGGPSAPAAPTNLGMTGGDARLELTWTAPAGTVTSYDVEYQVSTASGWTDAGHGGTTPSHTISSLINGTLYHVRVRAVNAGGNGAWVTASGTPQEPPSPPTVSLSATPRTVAEGSSVTVTATLSAPLGSDVEIPVALTAGTAAESDYGTLASITVSGGATSGTGTVRTSQDTDEEGDETFTVALDTDNLPSEVTAGSPNSVEITITDDDGPAEPAMPTLSSDATLSALALSGGDALAFAPETTAYAVMVAHEVESVTVTPTVNHAGAAVTVDGTAVESGTRSGSIALSVGENAVAVVVTAEDGATTRKYLVTVRRAVKVLGDAEKELVDKVGQALLGRDDPGVYPPEGESNR